MEFLEPDLNRFPYLGLAYDAMREGGTMPAAMSAANEVAVAAFLDRQIRFMDMPRTISEAMEAHETRPASSLEAVIEGDGPGPLVCPI